MTRQIFRLQELDSEKILTPVSWFYPRLPSDFSLKERHTVNLCKRTECLDPDISVCSRPENWKIIWVSMSGLSQAVSVCLLLFLAYTHDFCAKKIQ